MHTLLVLSAYRPFLQVRQPVEPAFPDPSFEYLPAMHAVHSATFEAFEYFPALHSVHELAPTFEPVFVIDPALQLAQS